MIIFDTTKKIHEQITPENWHKGSSFNGDKSCACLTMWVMQIYGHLQNVIFDKIRTHLMYPLGIYRWNDHPDRTFSDVKNLLLELDI